MARDEMLALNQLEGLRAPACCGIAAVGSVMQAYAEGMHEGPQPGGSLRAAWILSLKEPFKQLL